MKGKQVFYAFKVSVICMASLNTILHFLALLFLNALYVSDMKYVNPTVLKCLFFLSTLWVFKYIVGLYPYKPSYKNIINLFRLRHVK